MTEQSQLNRRQFLAAVGAAGFSLLTLGAQAASSAAAAGEATGNNLSLASLRVTAGSQFIIKTAEGKIGATLEAVNEDRICSVCEQFTATFRLDVASAKPLDSAVYDMRHPKLGNISLLLAPGELPGVMTASFCQLIG